jgi:hypothetical protein
MLAGVVIRLTAVAVVHSRPADRRLVDALRIELHLEFGRGEVERRFLDAIELTPPGHEILRTADALQAPDSESEMCGAYLAVILIRSVRRTSHR